MTLTSHTRCQAASEAHGFPRSCNGVTPSCGSPHSTPALDTNTSILPNSCRTSSTRPKIWDSSATSATTPSAPISSATFAVRGSSISDTTTVAPRPANRRHMASPMPAAPPVTTITLPAGSTGLGQLRQFHRVVPHDFAFGDGIVEFGGHLLVLAGFGQALGVRIVGPEYYLVDAQMLDHLQQVVLPERRHPHMLTELLNGIGGEVAGALETSAVEPGDEQWQELGAVFHRGDMQGGKTLEELVACHRREVVGDRPFVPHRDLQRRGDVADDVAPVFDVPVQAGAADLTYVDDHRRAGLLYTRPDRVENFITRRPPTAVGVGGLGPHHEDPRVVGQPVLDLADRGLDIAEGEVR